MRGKGRVRVQGSGVRVNLAALEHVERAPGRAALRLSYGRRVSIACSHCLCLVVALPPTFLAIAPHTAGATVLHPRRATAYVSLAKNSAALRLSCTEREFFIDNLLVRVYHIDCRIDICIRPVV